MDIGWAALSAASHTRLWEHFNTLADKVAAAFDAVPAGRIYKSNGFQNLSAGNVAITLGNLDAQGGVTYNAANGGGLRVPIAGRYQVNSCCYFSGAAGAASLDVVRWRAGVSVVVLTARLSKPDGQDYIGGRSDVLNLAAGDILTLRGSAPSSAYGTDGSHTSLSVARV